MAIWREGDRPKFNIGDKLRSKKSVSKASYSGIRDKIVTVAAIKENFNNKGADPFIYGFKEDFLDNKATWLNVEKNFELIKSVKKKTQSPTPAELFKQGKLRKGDWLVAMEDLIVDDEEKAFAKNKAYRITEILKDDIALEDDIDIKKHKLAEWFPKFRLPTKGEIRKVRKFNAGDKVEIVGKSIKKPYDFEHVRRDWEIEDQKRSPGFVSSIDKANEIWIRKKKKQDDSHQFLFAPKDLILIKPKGGWQVTLNEFKTESKSVTSSASRRTKPSKQPLTPQDLKTIDATGKILELFKKVRKIDGKYPVYGFESENRELVGPRVVDKTINIKKTFRSLAKVFYYLVSGESAHTNISFLLDDWPRLEDDNVWYIISMLSGWEKDGKRYGYKNKEEVVKDLKSLKEKIKSKVTTGSQPTKKSEKRTPFF